MAPNCAAIFVQTPVMASAFGYIRHQIRSGSLRSQTVPSHIRDCPTGHSLSDLPKLANGKPFRLLFLAAGHEHKNHGILPAVARELDRRGLAESVHIFVTLDPSAGKHEHNILSELSSFGHCISNLGRLPAEEVPRAFPNFERTFLPTLAESFGLIYLESMACGRPILTSDRDFARWMCGDLAFYFDPHGSCVHSGCN